MQLLLDDKGRVVALGPQQFTPAAGQQVIEVNAALTSAVSTTADALAAAQAAHEEAARQYESMRAAVLQAFAQVDGLVQTQGGAVGWDVAAHKFTILDRAPQPVVSDDELLAERAKQDPVLAALLRKLTGDAPGAVAKRG
jgi:hypothetical protein